MRRAVLFCLLAIAGCRASPAPVDPIARKADELIAAAAAAEPAITRAMKRAAAAASGHLEGLEHRLKTRASLMRKIRSRVAADPELTVEEPDIVDALRYTVILDDEPPGSYVIATRRLLAALEDEGHRVVRVKNYWPRGDNYSGVNAVLVTRDRLQWEVQFHTPASVAVRDEWHPSYERLREITTPIEERRRLFRLMTAPWEHVDVPEGVLARGSLHVREELRRYDPPR